MIRSCLSDDFNAGLCVVMESGAVPTSWEGHMTQAELNSVLSACLGLMAVAWVLRQLVRVIHR